MKAFILPKLPAQILIDKAVFINGPHGILRDHHEIPVHLSARFGAELRTQSASANDPITHVQILRGHGFDIRNIFKYGQQKSL
jgi:hypothetical protein